VVVRQIARDPDSSPVVCHSDHVSGPGHGYVADLHRHFNPRPVNSNLAVGEDFKLVTARDDGQTLLDRAAAHGAVVVDDDAESAADEVAHQQVRTVAGELEETTIERHEMLRAGQTGVTCSIT